MWTLWRLPHAFLVFLLTEINATDEKFSKSLALIWELFVNVVFGANAADVERSSLLTPLWDLFLNVGSGISALSGVHSK